MKHSRGAQRGLFKFWPTPESIYATYGIADGASHVCEPGCTQRYCLPNICIQRYFEFNHFPVIRPLEYSTEPSQFEISRHCGYGSFFIFITMLLDLFYNLIF